VLSKKNTEGFTVRVELVNTKSHNRERSLILLRTSYRQLKCLQFVLHRCMTRQRCAASHQSCADSEIPTIAISAACSVT
jgi:hypothetical protein